MLLTLESVKQCLDGSLDLFPLPTSDFFGGQYTIIVLKNARISRKIPWDIFWDVSRDAPGTQGGYLELVGG
jgi:hypothetical protein